MRKRLRFTKSRENGSSSTQTLPLPIDSPSKLSYHNILLNDFINQVCDGKVDPEIYEEFATAIRNKEQGYVFRLIKEVNILDTKYKMVQLIIKRLSVMHSDEVWEILKQIISVRPADTLQVIITRSGRMLMDIETKKKELEILSPVQKEGGIADRKYFSHMIKEVSKHMKIQIDRFKILLCDFVEMIIDMREYSEHLERELNKHKK